MINLRVRSPHYPLSVNRFSAKAQFLIGIAHQVPRGAGSAFWLANKTPRSNGNQYQAAHH